MNSSATQYAYASADVQSAVARELQTGAPDRLLRRAAAGLARICARMLTEHTGGVYGRRVVLLAGRGNNGADALLAGHILARRGVQVETILLYDTAYLPGVEALKRLGSRIIQVGTPDSTQTAAAMIVSADLIVDGIVGEQGSAGLHGTAGQLVNAIPDTVPVVAVDLPSGVAPNSGELQGIHVRATKTVAFAALKPCHLLPPACFVAGPVDFVDVGLPAMAARPVVRRMDSAAVAQHWPVPQRAAHKYSRGVLGVVAGSDTYPGAAVLACLGAVNSGAGIVRYIGPPTATVQVLTAAPEVVPGTGQVQAWLLGSGVEADPLQDNAIDRALASGLPCVVDAGALEACVRQRASGTRNTPGEYLLLTPHAGELTRTLNMLGHNVSRSQIEARPLYFATLLADHIQATVLLKGPATLIVGPEGFAASQSQAPPWLATAGAGDVLAGIAGALMSAGLPALDAGEMAAHVHGLAATRESRGGPVTASQLGRAVRSAITAVLSSHGPLTANKAKPN